MSYVFSEDRNYRYSSEWEKIFQEEEVAVKEKVERFRDTRRSACAEIRNKIKEANMEISELFSDGEYFDLQPQYCFCGDSPLGQEEYCFDHISSCLDREERITEFKNEVIKIVERSIVNFNQRRREIIEKAKQESQSKGVNIDFDFWEDSVR